MSKDTTSTEKTAETKKESINVNVTKATELIEYAATHRRGAFAGSFNDYIREKRGYGKDTEVTVTVKSDFGLDLENADLSKADFSNVTFEGKTIEFTGANLEGVNFSGAHLYQCDMTNCKASGIVVSAETNCEPSYFPSAQEEIIEKQWLEAKEQKAAAEEADSKEQRKQDGAKLLAVATGAAVTVGAFMVGMPVIAAYAPAIGAAAGVAAHQAISRTENKAVVEVAVGVSKTCDAAVRAVLPKSRKGHRAHKARKLDKKLQKQGMNTNMVAAGIVALVALPFTAPAAVAIAAGAAAMSTMQSATADALLDTSLGDRLVRTGMQREVITESVKIPVVSTLADKVKNRMFGFELPKPVDGLLTVICSHSEWARKRCGVDKSFATIDEGSEKGTDSAAILEKAKKEIKHSPFKTGLIFGAVFALATIAILSGVIGEVAVLEALPVAVTVLGTLASTIVGAVVGWKVHTKVEQIATAMDKKAVALSESSPELDHDKLKLAHKAIDAMRTIGQTKRTPSAEVKAEAREHGTKAGDVTHHPEHKPTPKERLKVAGHRVAKGEGRERT